MDILILTKLQDTSLSGYDIIGYIHRKYGVLISPGTIYSLLYTLERRGLIEGQTYNRKRMYSLTKKEDNQKIMKTNNAVQTFLKQLTTIETV